jgi:hypothetical protein
MKLSSISAAAYGSSWSTVAKSASRSPGELVGLPEPPGSQQGEADRIQRDADPYRIAGGTGGRSGGLRQRQVREARLRTPSPRRRAGQGSGHDRVLGIAGRGRLLQQAAQLVMAALGGQADRLVAAGGLHRPAQRDRVGVAVPGGAGPLRRDEQQPERIRPRSRADKGDVGGVAEIVGRLGSGGRELGRRPVVVRRLQQEPPCEGQVAEGPGELVWQGTRPVGGRQRRPQVPGHGVELPPPPAAPGANQGCLQAGRGRRRPAQIPVLELVPFSAGVELVGGKGPDGVQQPPAARGGFVDHQALVDQPAEHIGDRRPVTGGHRHDRVQVEAAGEDGEAAEQRSCLLVPAGRGSTR